MEATMAKPWITPNFKVFDVNGECTAYAGLDRRMRTDAEWSGRRSPRP